MQIILTKRDFIWSYFVQFFSMASGLLVLPFVLRILTPEEIGMNYLMMTVGSMVALFDFGFAPQFGRNISYIFSGAQVLLKEGLDSNKGENRDINYRLLATMIKTAQFTYKIIASIVLVVMLTAGTLYIYKVTDRFQNVNNSVVIWIVYSISTFFNIYFVYYTSLLSGQGKIMESKKAMFYSKITYIILALAFLFNGLGLLGVCIANLISPFVQRYLAHGYFFTLEFKDKIKEFRITKKDKLDLFSIIWFNSKKLGVVFIGTYCITRFGIFLTGFYLPLSEVSSYGLMMQLVGLVFAFAGTIFTIFEPKLSALKVTNDKPELLRYFSLSMGVFYVFILIGAICLLFFVPSLLTLMKSSVFLPATNIVLIYLIVMFLESNHSFFASIIVIGNNVPFMWIALINGVAIAFGSYLSLTYTSSGILGLVLVQGIVQLVYNNWKWPYVVCKEFGISFVYFFYLSINEVRVRINRLVP